jgi:hypothetical protein
MELDFLPLQEADYGKLCKFWKWWKFSIPPRNCLPNNGLGGIKIVDKTGEIICAGFLYETNSAIAWLEFIVVNPFIKDKKLRYDAQIQLISLLTVEAEEKGFSAVFASITHKNLIEKYVEVGYTPNPIPSTELVIAVK